MIRKVIAGTVITGAALAVLALPAHAGTNWHTRTCAAFATWETHKTRANMRVLITNSLHVSWSAPGSKYGLGSDVYELGGDVLSGKTQYVSRAASYVSKDCTKL